MVKGVYNMKKNDQLPVEKGTASKIYGLAYYEPQSGYVIAKEIGSQPALMKSSLTQLIFLFHERSSPAERPVVIWS